MTVWAYETLVINGAGQSSVSYLTIEDDDRLLATQEADAIYVLDGVALAAAPVVDVGFVDYQWIDGDIGQTLAMHFSIGNKDYYMLTSAFPADVIDSSTGFTSFGTVGGIHYTTYGGIVDDGKQFRGDALVLTTNGGVTVTDVQTMTVLDDDGTIQFDGSNGAPNSEVKGQAVAIMGNGADVDFNVTDAGAGDTKMVMVTVDYTTATGAGTFDAIRYGFSYGSDVLVYYIPVKGSVDLSTVVSVTGQTVLATSLDGMHYGDFGLGGMREAQNGDSADNLLLGDMRHDKLTGKGGQDTLIGGNGSDLERGGGGNDRLYGGAHADDLNGNGGADKIYAGIGDDTADGGASLDLLEGGWGDDLLFGGTDRDTLIGEDGDDTLDGGTGVDRLDGGDGKDELSGGGGGDALFGGIGADRLDGGTAADTLDGGGGADLFLFSADGSTDTIADFADGSDLIDVGVAFGSLVITTFAAGIVHITHSGELLVVQDTAGLLTAADFSAADFI